MTGRKFVFVLGTLFVIALVVYFVTTPRGADIPLTGVIDGNEVIDRRYAIDLPIQ